MVGDVSSGGESYKIENKHLQVLWTPLHLRFPAPVLVSPDADHPALELDRVASDVEGGGGLGDAAHPVHHPGHDPRIKKIKDPGRKWKLSELELDSGLLQSFLGSRSLDILPGPCLRCAARGLGEVTVDMTLKHRLK